MLRRAADRLLAVGSASRALGSDSPVMVALFTRTPKASISRQSAGTSSPSASRITSPGTSSADGQLPMTTPSRSAFTSLRQQLPERGQRLLGAVLLPEREQAVDHDHADDREAQRGHALPRLAPFGEERERRGDPENDREEVDELPAKRRASGARADFLHPVRTELGEAPGSLGADRPSARCSGSREPPRREVHGCAWWITVRRHSCSRLVPAILLLSRRLRNAQPCRAEARPTRLAAGIPGIHCGSAFMPTGALPNAAIAAAAQRAALSG